MFEQRTSQQKDACYCIPCNRKGDHTSLDSFCPKKKGNRTTKNSNDKK